MSETLEKLQSSFVKTKPSGPLNARVMFVGEAPGAEEEVRGVPFVGGSGDEFDRMLVEAGFLEKATAATVATGLQIGQARRLERNSKYFLTNVCKYRPPENKIEYFFHDSKQTKPNELILEGIRELKAEIQQVKPELIVCLGNIPLWALTGNRGIKRWRGSMLRYGYQDAEGNSRSALLLPTYHPAYILRDWENRTWTIHDLRRAKQALEAGDWPARPVKYIVRPSFEAVMDTLGTLIRKANERSREDPLELASDLETRLGYIACHGIAWSTLEAICIPRMCVERPTGYWSLDEDVAIWSRERELLTHANVSVIGQSYLYDAQYFARRCGYVPRLRHDVRFMQHVAWPGLPQTLDFMSSVYCQHHVYWKEDGKEWDPKKHPEERYWAYNCDDCSRTMEVKGALTGILHSLGFWELYQFQMSLWYPMLRLMLRGVKRDQMRLSTVAQQLMGAVQERESNLEQILGYKINLDSPKQVHNLFYDQLKCQIVRHPKTKRPTCDEDALAIFTQREPLLKPITQLIVEVRSLGAMMSNVIQAKSDDDGRLRSEFSPTTEAFRWNSRKNAWGGGTNMQNWTKGDEE